MPHDVFRSSMIVPADPVPKLLWRAAAQSRNVTTVDIIRSGPGPSPTQPSPSVVHEMPHSLSTFQSCSGVSCGTTGFRISRAKRPTIVLFWMQWRCSCTLNAVDGMSFLDRVRGPRPESQRRSDGVLNHHLHESSLDSHPSYPPGTAIVNLMV